jgi:hypothetical protein
MSKQGDNNNLPDAPDSFNCSITHDRMEFPVIAADGHSYEKSAIEKWFKTKASSPKTGLPLDSTTLLPNYNLQTQIKEWLDDQRKGHADKQNLNTLKGNLVSVSTSKEGQFVVQQMIQLITSSNFCLLSPGVVERFRRSLDLEELLDKELSRLLDFLASLCQSEINTKQEMHRELNTKCVGLNLAKRSVMNTVEETKNKVSKSEKKVVAAKKHVPIAQERLRAAQRNLIRINQAVEDAEEEHEEAEEKLVKESARMVGVNKLSSEYLNERENIERQLNSVYSMEVIDSGPGSSSSSSSSSLPAGSKRGRSSSSSSSSSSTTRGSKRAKKKKDGEMEMHPGQWLYKEGRAYCCGTDFKKIDQKRGQLMVKASASSGFPMAVAYCHYKGWNGLKNDKKKAFDMFVKIEKKTDGYHWAQYMLGRCYQYCYGVSQDDEKRFECHSLSSEQGNSMAMLNLGYCYSKGEGTDVNKTKAFEWYEKSANLGCCTAMYNVGMYYQHGRGGVTKDLNKAREWYTKAAAQGSASAQEALNKID